MAAIETEMCQAAIAKPLLGAELIINLKTT
jgi:hypothetical protein